ncbi:FIST signal transduction protein [Granulosicoccus sp. 3-233]|uniref:FIST signal transduction protein n=1 Tax=Granulosicoccus sp. 3-233 TaxID=3417969 RepID=UPI003D33DBA5
MKDNTRMPRLKTFNACAASTREAIEQLDSSLGTDPQDASIVFMFYGCGHDEQALHDWAATRLPAAALIGGSSSGGLITDKGCMGQQGVGLLLVDDTDGDYGVAAGPLGDDAALAAERLLQQALDDCDCRGQLPELIWVYQAPGHEEDVIAGLRRIVGDNCPIVGGSSADDDVSGRWTQMGPGGPLVDGLVLGVLFPSSSLGYAFQGGYEPVGPTGIVTGIGYRPAGESGVVTGSAGREILSIDDMPAAEVYNRWVDDLIGQRIREGGSILADTTMFPLATDAGKVDGVSHYLLIHPESIGQENSLRTFCNLEVGDRVYAMKGETRRLVNRAGNVADQARKSVESGGGQVAGGLVVFCGGCKIAVGEDIRGVPDAVASGLGDVPFIVCFTFGEQGRLIDSNVHGNLMISTVAFGI